MSESRQGALQRLWAASGALGDEPMRTFVRVRLVTSVVGISELVIVPVVFLAALVFHLRSLATLGIAILAIGMASNAVLEAFRIRWVLHLGHWTGWGREPIWRKDQPVRFWGRTAMHATILSVSAAAAVFLTWVSLSRLTTL